MRPPEFWTGGGPWARLLAPLACAVEGAGRARFAWARPARAGVPVICVGNLTVGGAGKTPVTLDIARRLVAHGHHPHVIGRGYGGKLTGPVRVDRVRHDAAAVGDEALLHAAVAPAWVARDRAAAARQAVAAGADAVVLDDGFQNPWLVKDMSLLVIDGGAGFGNGQVMPAGPLRELPRRGIARADAAVIIGPDDTGVRRHFPAGLPVFAARLAPDPSAAALAGKRVIGFAGIGRPLKFAATLAEIGCELVGFQPFPDHYRYDANDLAPLRQQAAATGARLVTTAKDAVRLPAEVAAEVTVVGVEITWQDAAAIDALILRPFDGASRARSDG